MNESLQAGFGVVLKAAREAQGLAISDVSDKIKLSLRQVEAIEAEDLEHLPQGIYLRGFVRNYARLVGVDAESFIVPVDAEVTVTDTITVKNEGVRLVSKGVKRWLVVPMLLMLLFLLLVGVLYEWLRSGESMVVSQSVTWSAVPSTAIPAISESVSEPTSVLSPAADAMPVAIPAFAPTTAVVQPVVPLASAQSPVAPLPMTAVAPTPPAVTPQTNAMPTAENGVSTGKHSLRFEVGQAAWISIVDAKGQRFSKLVPTGGLGVFRGEPPFRLVVGEASQVRLTYDGHLIDLSPYIGQKVARLTLE